MDIFRIYPAEIENENWTDGAEGWPVGTAKIVAERLEALFPGVEIEVVKNVRGSGAGYVGEDEELGRDIEHKYSEILGTL